MKKIIGIIGKSSSGKTLAGNYFKKLGADFINCDRVVSELYKTNATGSRKIETFFGNEFINKKGDVNTTILGIFISKDEKKLRILEKIIHPLVLDIIGKTADKSDKEIIFIEINAPSEKILNMCSKIILIEGDEKKRTSKIKVEYKRKIDAFKKLSLRKPDFKIKNTYNEKDFLLKIGKIYKILIEHNNSKCTNR